MDESEDDDDLIDCWSALEPIPSFVYTIGRYTGPEGLLAAHIIRFKVVRATDEEWEVDSHEVVWTGPKSSVYRGGDGRPGPVLDKVSKEQACSSASIVLDKFRDLRTTEITALKSRRAAVEADIQALRVEEEKLINNEKALTALTRPDIHTPIGQFEDLEKL